MRQTLLAGSILFGVLLSLLTLVPRGVSAQEVLAPKRSITIGPTSFQYQINPGASRDGVLNIHNDGQEYLQVHMYSQTFKVKGEDYGDYEFVGANPADAGGWIGFAPSDFNIAPDQKVDVNFTVLPPAQAAPGGYYVVMFAEAMANRGEQVSVAQRAGALVFIQVNGQLQKFGEVASFKTNFWQPQSPLKSELRLHNEGNTHWQAQGEVTYKNLLGLSIYRSPINGLVLPQTIRRFKLEQSPPVLVPGLYLVSGKVSIFDNTVKLTPRLILVLPPLYLGGFILGSAGLGYWLWRRKYSKARPHPARVY